MAYSPSTLPDFQMSDFGPEFRGAPTVPLRIEDIVVERDAGRSADRASGARPPQVLVPFADLPAGLDFSIDDPLLEGLVIDEAPPTAAEGSDWRPAEPGLGLIDRERARAQSGLFFLVAGASFIEGAAAAECQRLIEWAPAHEELAAWLETRWAPEEAQHGELLRQYVGHVWPEFDWIAGFEAFGQADADRRRQEGFATTPGQEMLARSVTEVGSAVFYRALQEEASEPHLQQLASRLRRDELRHYRHFQHFFRQFDVQERVGRKRIARTMWERLHRDRRGRASLALRHVMAARPAGMAVAHASPEALEQALAGRLHERYPIGMPVRMLLRSLDLPAAWDVVAGPVARLLRRSLA